MTQSSFQFRHARPGDGAALYTITERSIGALGKRHYSPEVLQGWMGTRTPDYYEADIGTSETIVAERDGQVVGFVDAVPGEIVRLFLLPEQAGRGLGKQLLKIGIDIARKGHDGPLRIVSTLNAEGFYARHGFQRVGHGKFAAEKGGMPVDVVYMKGTGDAFCQS